MDILSVALTRRRFSDKLYDIADFGKKDCLTISSLSWKQMTSLGQDEPVHTYTHPYTRHFIKEACYGERVGADIQDFESCANTNVNLTRSNLLGLKLPRDWKTISTSNKDDICNLLHEYKIYINVYLKKWN